MLCAAWSAGDKIFRKGDVAVLGSCPSMPEHASGLQIEGDEASLISEDGFE